MSKNYQFDIVQKPKHYTDTGIEHSDVVEAWNMDYFIGNCTKYLCRWEKKANPVQDLKKAAWYLARKIAHLEFPGLNTRESIRIVEVRKELEFIKGMVECEKKQNKPKKVILEYLEDVLGGLEGELVRLNSKVKK
jgi:hypothetical protein